MNGESVAANLTERGFKWFFRTTPVAGDFARIYLDFLKDMKAGGQKVDNIALVHENTEYGTSVASVITSVFKENGLSIAQDIAYSANTTDVQSQVLQLKDKKPDVVIMISYTSDAILYAKTVAGAGLQAADDDRRQRRLLRSLDCSRRSASRSQGIFNRSSFSDRAAGIADLPDQRDVQEEERRRRHGRYRCAARCRASSCSCDAIDRAGSTEPAKIQAALKATDLKPDQLIMGYKGVKFDDKGQNILAAGLVIQLQDGENYVPVWPKDSGQDRAGACPTRAGDES